MNSLHLGLVEVCIEKMKIDLKALFAAVMRHSQLPDLSIHGPDHWARVERNALYCARQSGGDELVVTLFALFHDAQRFNDGTDPEHGRRGAELAESLHGELFQLSDQQMQQLTFACEWHTFGDTSDDPTIGSCWDGDRLDLTRIGAKPDVQFMSTRAAQRLAEAGDFLVLDQLPKRNW